MAFENTNIIGQRDVIERLLLFDKEERIPHAMLFVGPQGVGKMAVAIEFAKHLLKKNDPHGNAKSMLAHLSHPDLIFSYPVVRPNGSDKPAESDDFRAEWTEMLKDGHYFSNEMWLENHASEAKMAIISVGESNALIKKLSLKSSQGGYKICIIWQAEKMNLDSANKLLKIIEEPPSQTIFILTTEHPELILETIRSRTQLIKFKPIAEEDLTQALISKRAIDADNARRVARASNGSWLQALNIISGQSERQEFLEVFISLMRLCYKTNVLELKQWCSSVCKWSREKQKRFLEYCLSITRETFMYNFHAPELCYMTIEEENFSKNFAPYINEYNILGFNKIYNTAIRDITRNALGNIVFFDMAMKIITYLRRRQ